MSASPTNTASEPKDNQERRLRLKREAISLGGELAAYGARVQVGKVTPLRAILEVRQDRRDRQDVVVTIEDDAPVYTLSGAHQGEELLDSLAVRRRLIAPPDRWSRWWLVLVSLVAWLLVAIGWAIFVGNVKWFVLAGIVAAGTLLTLAAAVLIGGAVRAGRRHRAVTQMLKRR